MKLTIITPVGPGHETIVGRASDSVLGAIDYGTGYFRDVEHLILMDTQGANGRSATRNKGIRLARDSDWLFFLDADDMMCSDALCNCSFNGAATFGSVYQRGGVIRENVFPCSWQQIVDYGARGTLSMGFFCRADVAARLLFDESLDAGEDFDFYMRLPDFVKIAAPLVEIGRDAPSAVGPRGYRSLNWIEVCNRVIEQAISREPYKFGVPIRAAAS